MLPTMMIMGNGMGEGYGMKMVLLRENNQSNRLICQSPSNKLYVMDYTSVYSDVGGCRWHGESVRVAPRMESM